MFVMNSVRSPVTSFRSRGSPSDISILRPESRKQSVSVSVCSALRRLEAQWRSQIRQNIAEKTPRQTGRLLVQNNFWYKIIIIIIFIWLTRKIERFSKMCLRSTQSDPYCESSATRWRVPKNVDNPKRVAHSFFFCCVLWENPNFWGSSKILSFCCGCKN
jgi:hypothetical protein